MIIKVKNQKITELLLKKWTVNQNKEEAKKYKMS